jgi:glycosyltransferase involved in cell wall biosynthesis
MEGRFVPEVKRSEIGDWESRDEGLESRASSPVISSQPATSKKPILVVAPGFARHEKGSDLLQRAIKLLKTGECGSLSTGRPVRFVLQWQEDFAMPDGSMQRPDRELVGWQGIQYLQDILTGQDYWDFLMGGDLVVLPYRLKSYGLRVSRVSVEAALLGKPIIFSRGTWSGEVAELAGGGCEIEEETPESIARSIVRALKNFDVLKAEASLGAHRVRDFYSVGHFRRLLLEVGAE